MYVSTSSAKKHWKSDVWLYILGLLDFEWYCDPIKSDVKELFCSCEQSEWDYRKLELKGDKELVCDHFLSRFLPILNTFSFTKKTERTMLCYKFWDISTQDNSMALQNTDFTFFSLFFTRWKRLAEARTKARQGTCVLWVAGVHESLPV